MRISILILCGLSFCLIPVSQAVYALQKKTPSSNNRLLPRVKIDIPDDITCNRRERRVIVGALREAAYWVRLATDTTEDRQVERPDNEQYQAWRAERRRIFGRVFGSALPRTRAEFGEIFEALKWEIDRSPGGSRQNDDNGGNVVG